MRSQSILGQTVYIERIHKKRICHRMFLVLCFFCMMFLSSHITEAQMGPADITGYRDFQWPVPGYYNITSCYYNYDFATHAAQGGHCALDIWAPTGTAVVAAYGGTVKESTYNSSWGNTVVIEHSGYKGVTLYTRYSHMNSLMVSVGTPVSKGQQIGTIGATGAVTGEHLDFSVMKDSYGSPWRNYAIDPFACQLLELPNGFHAADGSAAACCYTYVDEVKALYSSEPIDPNTPNPIYKKSYWGPQTATTIRPIVEIKNPETVEKVRFPVWTADNQSDIKWVDAVHNGYGSFFADIPIEGFVSNNYKCHVYIYGKNGSDRAYVLTADYPDPVYKLSYWGTQTETIRQPVISFRNSDMVEEVIFAVWTTENQSDLKWIKATPNGYGSWFTEFNVSEFTNRDFLCHAYVTGKNGDVRSYILTADYPDPVCKDSYILKLSETSITPVAEFSNPDMVEEVTFAIWTTENQSDIKWIKGFPNGYGSWANELSADDFTYRQFTCHIYIKGKNGSEQYVQMKDTFHLDEHQWGSPSYEWDNENNKLTATYICALNSNHIKTEVIDNPQVLRLPAQLQEIEEEAFTGLTCQVVIIPESCTIIGSRAFANCDELLYVDIPSTVSIIADDAFEGCDNYILPQ